MQSRCQEVRSSVAQGLCSVFQEQQAQGNSNGDPVVWVHQGFLDAYASMRSELLRLLETVLAGEEEPWTLYVTGHSLGGALSTLCTYDCARRTWRGGVSRPRIVHYNYGSPRVGNKAFAEDVRCQLAALCLAHQYCFRAAPCLPRYRRQRCFAALCLLECMLDPQAT